MDGRCSRIPVHSRFCRPEPSAELQVAFPSKRKCASKTSDPKFSGVPSLQLVSNVTVDSVFKAANQGLPKSDKRVEPVPRKTVARRPLGRHQLEAELKKKDQLVETLKKQLARAEMLTQKVTEELKLYCHTVAKEKEMLETAMAKWKSVLEENQRSLEKHSHFQAQIKEWTAALEALGNILAM
ncbi:PREDICTED: uncharacterized protein LOC106628484 isoform X2 [Pseudopodoces humilis]|uniref:uncharacterized protein LOC106628484 isoform X2 n=1 Tax=Pseudopodoces humilis TaxID=181119 RepID=UPI0006B7471B|nr:PREDICTED: uncharacterized protein LOC106628484 isoform X2 [Pseudopodoces humilis]